MLLFNTVTDDSQVLEQKERGMCGSLELAKGQLYCSKKGGANLEL